MDHREQKALRNRLHAKRLRETAATAPADGPLKDRLLRLATQYDRLAQRPGSVAHTKPPLA